MRKQLGMVNQLWNLTCDWGGWCVMGDFLRNRVARSPIAKLIGRTVLKWQQDECLEMGAALAYYAMFSLFPMLLVSLSVLGNILPNTMVYNQILFVAKEALPADAFQIVQTTLIQFHTGSTSASIIGSAILLFTASGFFGALSRSFDKIWRVQPKHQQAGGNAVDVVLHFLGRRIFAFLLVIGSTSVIFLSLLSNIVIDILMRLLEQVNERMMVVAIDQVQLLPWLQSVAAFLMLMLVVTVLFKILPSTRVRWGDIWLGSVFTVVLWLILQQLISNSVVSLGSRFRSYGVVGGVMVLMLWIYLTSQIFFLGGELTYVYAHMFGSRRGDHKLQS